MTNISERVKGIIAKHLGIDRDKVTEDANFIDDLGADSLDTVELAMSLEDELVARFLTKQLKACYHACLYMPCG